MREIDPPAIRKLVLRYLSQLSRSPGAPIEVWDLEGRIGEWWSKEQGESTPPTNGDWAVRLGPEGVPKVHEVVWDLVVQRVLTLSKFRSQGFARAENWK
jgi:hypothetical protein